MRNGAFVTSVLQPPPLQETKWHGLWLPGFPGCCWPVQVPKGARRQALWVGGRPGHPQCLARVTSSQLLNSRLYSHSEAWWSDQLAPFARDWVFPGHGVFSANSLEVWSPNAGISGHRQRVNIQHPLSEPVEVWNRELARVSVSFFCQA